MIPYLSTPIILPVFLLFARIILAAVMLYYGTQKVRDLRANAEDFVKKGFRPGMFWGTLIAAVEFLGGLLILLGVYVEIAAAFFAFQMVIGTFWKLKTKKGFPNYSYDILLFVVAGFLVGFGGGTLTLAAYPVVADWVLRWDTLVGVLILAGLGVFFCKPAR